MDEKIVKDLEHKHYGVYGNHSAVEICEWNKRALRGEGACYKQKFYNVEGHRCAQITPSAIWCHQNCSFCWRPTKYMQNYKIDETLDDPKDIINGLFEKRKLLLSGFKGNKKVDNKLYDESIIPSHIAISLSGEPTVYPYLDEMIKILNNRKEIKTVFLVTNGLEPEMLKKLNKSKETLPTQIYLSLESANKQMHLEINKPKLKDSWKILNQTIELYKDINTRKIVRFTLIKGINDSEEYLKDFIEMFEKTNTDFLEVKAYMNIGAARNNLSRDNMPTHQECLEYSEKIQEKSNLFKIRNQDEKSRIVLLKNKESKIKDFIL